MEKIHKNIRVFMLSCTKHACFHVFSPFSAYFFSHDIIAEKGLLARPYQQVACLVLLCPRVSVYLVHGTSSSVGNLGYQGVNG